MHSKFKEQKFNIEILVMKMTRRNYKVSFYGSLLFVLLLSACNKQKEVAKLEMDVLSEEFSDVDIKELQPVDTLYSFSHDYPVRVEKCGDKLVLLFAQQDTVIKIMDLNSREIKPLTIKGNGPNDVLSPSFFNNHYVLADGGLNLYDGNLNEIVSVYADSLKLRKTRMPKILMREGSINYFGDTAASYTLMKSDNLFNITDIKANDKKAVAYPFELSEESMKMLKRFPTYLSSIINANRNKDRIVVSQYYFDMYYVYDFKGNLLKSVNLSGDVQDINEDIKKFFDLSPAGYIRYAPGYASENGVYLRRLKEMPLADNRGYDTVESHIVKIDWDGVPQLIIHVPEGLNTFCVDEQDRLIAIINSTDSEGNEIFHLVRYK